MSLQKFDQEKYRVATLKWVVMSSQPFSEIQSPEYREMVRTLNPTAKNISDKTIKKDLMASFNEHLEKIKTKLQVFTLSKQISLDPS